MPKAKRSDDIASFSIDKSQIGRKKKDDIFITTGKEGVGKSAWMMQMAHDASRPGTYRTPFFQVKDNEPGGVGEFDLYSAYSKMKADRIAQITAEQDRGNYWELFGRLLGMALQSGDESFYRLLEGIHAGYRNEQHGRPALGKMVVPE